eukprot:symbB.v1.2.040016.t1/scaffold6937.1/size14437/1
MQNLESAFAWDHCWRFLLNLPMFLQMFSGKVVLAFPRDSENYSMEGEWRKSHGCWSRVCSVLSWCPQPRNALEAVASSAALHFVTDLNTERMLHYGSGDAYNKWVFATFVNFQGAPEQGIKEVIVNLKPVQITKQKEEERKAQAKVEEARKIAERLASDIRQCTFKVSCSSSRQATTALAVLGQCKCNKACDLVIGANESQLLRLGEPSRWVSLSQGSESLPRQYLRIASREVVPRRWLWLHSCPSSLPTVRMKAEGNEQLSAMQTCGERVSCINAICQERALIRLWELRPATEYRSKIAL